MAAAQVRAAQWSTEEVDVYMDPKSSLKSTKKIRSRELEVTQRGETSGESLALSISLVVSLNPMQHY